VIRPYKGADFVRIVVKGAPEIVMQFCTKMLDSTGESVDLNNHKKHQILQKEIIDNYAKSFGYRTFMYAYKDINSDEWENLQAENNNFVEESKREIVEQELTFVAGFGIEDKLRKGVFESVVNLNQAKIKVRMISGDSFETATRCAVKAGIIKEAQVS
jgi:P-type Ca2+ transporter type 2C